MHGANLPCPYWWRWFNDVGIFRHTLGLLTPINYCLSAIAYLSIVAMCIPSQPQVPYLLMANFSMNNAPCNNANTSSNMA